jgi:hemin uptake protein HemP
VQNRPALPISKNEKPPVEVEVANLMGTEREIVLVHRGERYRLRVTANGKLILTK